MKHKCEDCKHCDIKTMKCRPQSEDCHAEYNLTKEDLKLVDRCDFFEPRD